MRLKRPHVAIALIAIALVVPTTAVATHVFSDVRDDRFFAVPVSWASTNGITTGTSPTTFEPDRGVTRGESVTFLKRYDDNIVQPALTTLTGDVATNSAGVATNAAGVATNAAGVATNTAGVATNAADIAALEAGETVEMVIGAGAFSGQDETFTTGCQYNPAGAGDMRAGVPLPVGSTILEIRGHLLGTGSDLQLVRTAGATTLLGTLTTATAPLDVETHTLVTPEVVETGEFFTLEWEPDTAGNSDQICGVSVVYSTGTGAIGLAAPTATHDGTPTGE